MIMRILLLACLLFSCGESSGSWIYERFQEWRVERKALREVNEGPGPIRNIRISALDGNHIPVREIRRWKDPSLTKLCISFDNNDGESYQTEVFVFGPRYSLMRSELLIGIPIDGSEGLNFFNRDKGINNKCNEKCLSEIGKCGEFGKFIKKAVESGYEVTIFHPLVYNEQICKAMNNLPGSGIFKMIGPCTEDDAIDGDRVVYKDGSPANYNLVLSHDGGTVIYVGILLMFEGRPVDLSSVYNNLSDVLCRKYGLY